MGESDTRCPFKRFQCRVSHNPNLKEEHPRHHYTSLMRAKSHAKQTDRPSMPMTRIFILPRRFTVYFTA